MGHAALVWNEVQTKGDFNIAFKLYRSEMQLLKHGHVPRLNLYVRLKYQVKHRELVLSNCSRITLHPI